jgi:hypothetical protein
MNKILIITTLFIASLLLFIASCKKDPLNPTSNQNHCKDFYGNQSIIGSGTDEYKSFRNNHYELIISKPNSIVTFKSVFTGTIGRIYVLNSAGNYIKYSNSGVDAIIENYEFTIPGKYYVVICSEKNGNYDLELCGDLEKINRIDNFLFSITNQILNSGGGIDADKSRRNKHYTFTVNEDNAFVDFVVNSKNINCRIYIQNSAGTYIKYSSTGRVLEQITAFEFLNRGNYTIVVCGEEDKKGSFDLSFFAKNGVLTDIQVSNNTSYTTHCGDWNPGGGIDSYLSPLNDKYSFTIINRAYVDIIANVSGSDSRLYLLNSANNYIKYSSVGLNPKITEYDLLPGTYTLVMNAEVNKSGNYCVSIYGKEGSITDLTPK